jgi:hypothetical protein
MNDRDVDAFFDALKGTPSGTDAPQPPREMGQRLRQAILDERDARHERLLATLEKQGAFKERRAPETRPSWTARLADWLAPRPAFGLGFAAIAVLAVTMALNLGPNPADRGDEGLILRGAADPTLEAADPQAVQARLAEALRAAGAEVTVVPLSETSWSLVIQATPEVRAATDQVLLRFGLQAMTAPEVSVTVRQGSGPRP